jgi:anti-anti-sigma factor
MSATLSALTGSPQLHVAMSFPSPRGVRVVVVGEVDLATTAVLHDGLLGVLRDKSPALVDVDLAGVTFMDCTGVGALIAVHTTAARSGCRLRVSHPQPIVGRVLAVTGALSVLTTPIESWELRATEPGSPSAADPPSTRIMVAV